MRFELGIRGTVSILLIATEILLNRAAAQDCGAMTILSTTTNTGEKRELIVDSSAINKTREWTPGKGEPFLSISRAIEIATQWNKTHHSPLDRASIQRVTLASSTCFGASKHWYYILEFTPAGQSNGMQAIGYWEVVLLDGSVIETRSSKEKQSR